MSRRPVPPPRAWSPGIVVAGVLALAVASFATLDLQVGALFAEETARASAEFLAGFAPPDLEPRFLRKAALAMLETLSMSAIGTLLAAAGGLALALPAASRQAAGLRRATRLLLNMLRSVPELVWAALLLVAAGLGPFAGTLALAAHTAGVLGRLFADALENVDRHAGQALRTNGAGQVAVFLYATLPQVLPQMLSYTLYRWENNIRAAAVLGVVGAGGLGQMLKYHLSLFQMESAATVIVATILLVALVDSASFAIRRHLSR
jgi:phosphonate transport system permease protein